MLLHYQLTSIQPQWFGALEWQIMARRVSPLQTDQTSLQIGSRSHN